MAIGISVYPGLDNRTEENVNLIRRAAKYGVSRLFTSLHIPEHDKTTFKEDLRTILDTARNARLELIADVTPESADILGIPSCTPEAFYSFGISILRLDDGFNAAEIAEFTRSKTGARLQLNASTISEEFLLALSRNNADFSRLEALHNFYPRQNTGVSVRLLSEKTRLLHRFGIRTGAFVATQNGKKRAPLCEGLPTLELHRNISVDLAVRHLYALEIDDIFIGDSLPTDAELTALTNAQPDCVTIYATPVTGNNDIRRLLAAPFTARPDEARDSIRAAESRGRIKELGFSVPPENTGPRSFGTITLDNVDYGRYEGELQIVKRNLPADPRTNVIAFIKKEELFLIPCIHPGNLFQIRLADT